MSEVVFCSVFRGRNAEVVQNIRNHSPFVDRTFIVLHGNTEENKENIDFLQSDFCKSVNVSWQLADIPYNPVALRNTYLKILPVDTWCLQLDCDEFLELPAAYQLRSLTRSADTQGINRIAFNAHDIRVGLDGSTWDNLSNYYNPLFIKIFPGTSWVGETHGGIHTPGVNPQIGQAPYRYFHIKSTASEYLRGCRNYWTTGQSAQNNTSVPEWIEFKKLCGLFGFETFDQIYPALLKGSIPEPLKSWFVAQRNNENSEARSWFIVYFGLLHPEENIYLAGNKEIPYDKNRQPYKGEMTF